MTEHAPDVVRALLAFSRRLVAGIGSMVEDPALVAAVRRDLGLPVAAAGAVDAAQINQQLAAIDGKLAEFDAQPGDNLAFDESIVEFLVGGRRFVELMEVMLPGKPADDPRTYADIAYAFATIFGSEWLLRPRAPWAWAIVRLLMLGYERVEEVPRLDPFAIFDRLSGQATKASTPGFGAVEALGGLVVPTVVILASWLMHKQSSDQRRIVDLNLKRGDPYLAGDLRFKLGWEPSPGVSPELQTMLARSFTLGYQGALKRHDAEDEQAVTFLVSAVALEEADGGPGMLLRLGGEAGFKLPLPGAAGGAIERSLEFKAVGGPGADFLWHFDRGFEPLGAAAGDMLVELAFENEGTETVPAFRIGHPGKSRFDLVGLKLGWTIGPKTQFGYVEFEQASFVVKFTDLVPIAAVQEFFAAIGADKISGRLDARLKLDAREGIVFEGAGGLKARIASNATLSGVPVLGDLRFDYIDLEIGIGDGGFSLGAAVAARFKVGTFAASIDRVGLIAKWKQVGGALEIKQEFKPPKGIGLRIGEEPFAHGGGFLMLDHDKGEFAGAIEITTFKGLSIQALVILSTKVPADEVKFALFVMGHLRIPGGFELGFRFTLNAVGLLLGLQHGFDRAALENALPGGAMDDVLFPQDIVGDAPRILQSLRSIFPVRPGALTIGLMLELGWGSDYLCSLRLGLIVPLENVFEKAAPASPERDRTVFQRVVLIGRIAVVAFHHLPKPIRISMICDFVGELVFDPFSVRFFARLRDSRMGTIAIEGAVFASLTTGGKARLILAAGGFHPNYKQVPADVPASIDRLAATYDIGLVKAWLRAYLAVAPGALQFGAEAGIRYAFGPLSLGGEFGFDVLIELPPAFRFEATVHGSVGLKYRGHMLMGVSVKLLLSGPRRWRAKGRGEFSILFWDIDIEFDESWGHEDAIEHERRNVAALVQQDLRDATNWRLELPAMVTPLVTLAGAHGDGAAAHPLSMLSYTQRRVPFGLELQRYGNAAVEGPTLFPVPLVTNEAGQPLGAASVLAEPFAVAEYRDLSDDERLSQPSFQLLAAGVAVGGAAYTAPAGTEAKLDVEQVFLDSGSRFASKFVDLERPSLMRLASTEAAGRSAMRFAHKLADRTLECVVTQPPHWVAAEPGDLKAAAVGAVPDWAAGSPAFVASHRPAARRLLVVEAFETYPL